MNYKAHLNHQKKIVEMNNEEVPISLILHTTINKVFSKTVMKVCVLLPIKQRKYTIN